MGFNYVPVPWPVGAPDPQPAPRAELEDLGFRVLGGCALDDDGLREVEKMARAYGERADEFARWAAVPGQVLAAPDATAYAHLSWLWDCRFAVLTTVLADGSLVQTAAEWGSAPLVPDALARHQDSLDRITEQLTMTTDPHARVVPGPLVDVWEAHRSRLPRPAVGVPAHSALEDFVAVYVAESRSRGRWGLRMQVVAMLIAVAVVLVPYLAAGLVLGAQPWWVDVLLLAGAVVAAWMVFVPVWLRSRRWRALRPAFRAPVPGHERRTA